MHVDVSPRQIEVQPGVPQTVVVSITNTGRVIGGYTLRVLGADPGWISMSAEEVSLFPDESATIVVQVDAPASLAVGQRVVTVQVREQTDPFGTAMVPLTLIVPAVPRFSMTVDPLVVTAGRRAALAVVVVNEGNTVLDGALHGQDPDDRVTFRFDPPNLVLPPGESRVVEVRARARRPWAGAPMVRPLDLWLLDGDQRRELGRSIEDPRATRVPLRAGMRRRSGARLGDSPAPSAQATFVQRPLVSRGSLALVGLLAALTVFALVITVSLTALVGQSAADRDLALRIAAARDGGSGAGNASLAGRVAQLTDGRGAANINVTVFSADDTVNPLRTTVTGPDGRWAVGGLPAGDYKARFQGAGFVELWYPAALTAADGEVLTVGPGERRSAEATALGGLPATIRGTVDGGDIAGATVSLKVRNLPSPAGAVPVTAPPPSPITVGDSRADASSGSALSAPSSDVVRQEPTVVSVPVAADGRFELAGVPSPQTYDLLVEKDGFAPSIQVIDVAGGETRMDVDVTLRQGDGEIRGIVRDATGRAVGGANIVATAGQASVSTRSQSGTGAFVLESLPTPASLSVVVTADGYAAQTLNVSMAPRQILEGIEVTLPSSSGQVTGRVRVVPRPETDALPPSNGGVVVTVTDGTLTLQTVTRDDPESPDDDGTWSIGGLPVPGEYTITFERADLTSQTVALKARAGERTLRVADRRMHRSTGVVFGTVREQVGSDGAGIRSRRIGEVSVQLTSATTTFSVTSASGPRGGDVGTFQLDDIPPGTYTLQAALPGRAPATRVVTVDPGTPPVATDLLLDQATRLTVVATGGDGDTVPREGWVVELYKRAEYPGVPYRVARLQRDPGRRSGLRALFEGIDAPASYVVQLRRSEDGAVVAALRTTVALGSKLVCTITVPADRSRTRAAGSRSCT